MATQRPRRSGMRLAILDDNPFVRLADGSVRPQAATFHLFAAEVVRQAGIGPAAYLVPVRALGPTEVPPRLDPVDPGLLDVVATRPFAGAAGYLRGIVPLTRANWPVVRTAVGSADLLWIKAPASNGLLAALAARSARVSRFTWVAGSARAVVAGQHRAGWSSLAARGAATLYDGVTALLARTGPVVTVGTEFFTSVVGADEILDHDRAVEAGDARPPGDLRLVWAGRVTEDKGLDDLLTAVASLRRGGRALALEVIGDGPARAALEAHASARALDGHLTWTGAIGDRATLLATLRRSDLFVLPSRAEGLPKVVVEAMAAGLPVVGTSVGAVAELIGDDVRGIVVPPRRPDALAAAIARLTDDDSLRERYRAAGLAFARDHTREAQAGRLIAWLQGEFPRLPWGPRT